MRHEVQPNLSLNRTARRLRCAPSARGRLAWFVERQPFNRPLQAKTRYAISLGVG